MKWPGEAIWSILLPKNQTETKNFHFPFFPCFSPLSWLQVLELPWDHSVLTKKSFWIVKVDFLDLIFHLKSLSDHSGKIPVWVKNQGTFYLKGYERYYTEFFKFLFKIQCCLKISERCMQVKTIFGRMFIAHSLTNST